FLFSDPQPATRPILLYKAWPLPPPGSCPAGAEVRPIWKRGCITGYDCANPVSEDLVECARSSRQHCVNDSECAVGGCNGDLCFTPSLGLLLTSCDCLPPEGVVCGCVNGQCTWFYAVHVQ